MERSPEEWLEKINSQINEILETQEEIINAINALLEGRDDHK